VIEALKPISNPNKDISDKSHSEQIAYLRATAIGKAISSCVKSFKENYEDIMQGQFNNSLVKASDLASAFEDISGLASKRIFTARRKTELEVSGRSVLRRVMSNLIPVYEELSAKGWDAQRLSPHNIQILGALEIDLKSIKTNAEALHSMSDFVSGMTDRYAVKVSKQLSGIQYRGIGAGRRPYRPSRHKPSAVRGHWCQSPRSRAAWRCGSWRCLQSYRPSPL